MPESNPRAVLLVSVKNWLTYDRCTLFFFFYKNTKNATILKGLVFYLDAFGLYLLVHANFG